MANNHKNFESGTPSSERGAVNRLAREKSPYLLLHARNPVDWFAWGEEAFEKARRENKPIFLSVGYYTCHWCHVMERESFADLAVAEILNRHFVSIKLDREERPDVDRIYMTYVQAATGSGGWPMSVFLTPDLEPFFGGTYWPPDDAYGRPGFRSILERIAEAWEHNRVAVQQAAKQATSLLEQVAGAHVAGGKLHAGTLDTAFRRIRASYDPTHGGFGDAPKFPRPVVLNFLLRAYARTGERAALEMVLHTLRAMADGGIHDHLGGGFHRYSTDGRWHLPHFEKMLYDQAQLAISYVEAFQITRELFYAETARDVLDFVLGGMRAPEGGFYSAQDADSLIHEGSNEHGEGAFYVWEEAEISEALDVDAAAVFNFVFGVEPGGNVPPEQDFRQEFTRKNVLYLRHSIQDAAGNFGKGESELRTLLAESRRKLFEARAKRPRPPTDDKIITAWNGLMISAFARAGAALDEARYFEAAVGAAKMMESRSKGAEPHSLKRRYRQGEAAIDGFLDDYAFLIQGLLDLYEAAFEVHWLAWAVELQETQDRLFWDANAGGYFGTTGDDPSVIVRTREDYDGAEPSPNSVAAMNLLRLAEMTGRKELREKADQTLAAFAHRLETIPEAMPQMLAALDFSLSKPKQIIIAGEPAAGDTRALLRLVRERFIPNKILLLADGGDGQRVLARWLPFIEGMSRLNGRATAYVCENYACQLPTSDPQSLARLLDSKA
jgi:uncharacterized protein